MEQTKEGGNTKEKMVTAVDSSSKHVEDKDPAVKQNLTDLNFRRTVSYRFAKMSMKKRKLIKKLEDEAKMLQDQLALLKPLHERQQKHLQRLMEEEKALLQEMHDLQEKALLRDAEDEKNRNTIKSLKELQQKQLGQLLNVDIDPLDPVFNAAQDGGSGSKSS